MGDELGTSFGSGPLALSMANSADPCQGEKTVERRGLGSVGRAREPEGSHGTDLEDNTVCCARPRRLRYDRVEVRGARGAQTEVAQDLLDALHPFSAGLFRLCSARSFCRSASDLACEEPSMAFSAISWTFW